MENYSWRYLPYAATTHLTVTDKDVLPRCGRGHKKYPPDTWKDDTLGIKMRTMCRLCSTYSGDSINEESKK